jgi:indolepyruvate ferredoxin oxidoreductase
MAYKDEYEVARLLADPAFEARVGETFDKPRRIVYHLHPPLLRRFGVKKKLALGPWAKPLLRLVASFKALRGTVYDPFGRMASRRLERELAVWYRQTVETLLGGLTAANLGDAVELARAPEQIRGYESLKEESARSVRAWVGERLRAKARRTAA